MAPRLFLALVAVVGIMWYLSWYHRADRQRRNKSLIRIALWSAAILLVILAITKGSVLMAMFGAALPWLKPGDGGEAAMGWFTEQSGWRSYPAPAWTLRVDGCR